MWQAVFRTARRASVLRWRAATISAGGSILRPAASRGTRKARVLAPGDRGLLDEVFHGLKLSSSSWMLGLASSTQPGTGRLPRFSCTRRDVRAPEG